MPKKLQNTHIVVIVLDGTSERIEAELIYLDDDCTELQMKILTGPLMGRVITPKTHRYRIVKILDSPNPVIKSG